MFNSDPDRMRPKDDHLVDEVTLNAVDLGTVESWDASCAFCMHLRSGYRLELDFNRYKGKYWHLSFFKLKYCRGLRLNYRDSEGMFFWTLKKPEDSDVFILPVKGIDIRQTACIFGNKVDFDLISNWLSICDNEHTCHFAYESRPHANRVIDCETRTLVPHNGEDYVALSYVWGKCALPTPEEDNAVRISKRLPPTVPQTIEDAILITRRIGKRFLWVDRYCVDQYHSDQKRSQINAMGDIYEGATLTILALVDDAHEGIPGVSQDRTKLFLIDSPTTTYTSTCQFMSEIINEASYSQRAWTYQEFHLSKRLMVFSRSQVFFRCGQNNFQEGLTLPPNRQRLYPRRGSNFSFRTPVMPYTGSNKGWMTATYRQRLEDLKKPIIDYSQRTMTYGSDALNAFRGILTRSGLKTFYGHPVHAMEDHSVSTAFTQVIQDRRAFTRSLLWPTLVNRSDSTTKHTSIVQYLDELRSSTTSTYCSEYTREPTLPTWSWTSSRPISIAWKKERVDLQSPTFETRYCSFPTVYVIDEKMQEITLVELALRHSDHMLPETSHRLIIKNAVVLKHLDLFRFAIWVQDHKQFNKTPLTPPGFENWPCPDMGLDPSAGPEIMEILTGEAQLHALLIDASSTNPVSFHGCGDQSMSSSGYLSSYFEGRVALKFLLVYQKGAQPCKRVGKLSCWLLKGGNDSEDWNVFSRERVELV